MTPQEVKFFKIDEDSYNPVTSKHLHQLDRQFLTCRVGIWGTTNLIKNNNSRTVQIPSDVKSGLYILRHEILSLHFVNRTYPNALNPKGPPAVNPGPQFYPICANVEITGTGSATPEGVMFPGGYNPTDPGITTNSYYGTDTYV